MAVCFNLRREIEGAERNIIRYNVVFINRSEFMPTHTKSEKEKNKRKKKTTVASGRSFPTRKKPAKGTRKV